MQLAPSRRGDLILALASVLAGMACDKPTRTLSNASPITEAGAVTPLAPSSPASPASLLADGAHDFRGTVGSAQVVLRLSRTGGTVTGSYVYRSIGRALALTGTIDGAGEITLTEAVKGKTTGVWTLRPDAAGGFVGRWSGPTSTNASDVHLAPGDAWGGVFERAETCLADVRCAASEVARLMIEADDDHEAGSDCFRFLDGAGVPRDVARGRACLERTPWKKACEGGSSADLVLAELALLHIDGLGGNVDVAGGRAMVASCADDVTKDQVLAHAAARQKDPQTPVADFCKELGGTTLTMNSCGARSRANVETSERMQAKAVAATLDEASLTLLIAAEKAHDAYVDAMGRDVYQAFIEGSIRDTLALDREMTLVKARTDELAAMKGFKAVATSGAALNQAEARARQCVRRATETDDEKAALLKTELTWAVFRDADAAFYLSTFGRVQVPEAVRGTSLVLLETRRGAECALPSLAPE